MLSSQVIRQLLAAQQLCSSSSATAAAVAVATSSGQHLCSAQRRSAYSTAIQQTAGTSTSDVTDASTSSKSLQADRQDQLHGGRSSRALPPSSTYGLKITIKAHDLIFVKMASTAIRDLVLVNFAPKSRDVLPDHWRSDDVGAPWVNLAMPVGDRALPTRRTHFTVISGPHVHKTAREQFARTTHSRVIQVATNNVAELNWLLHSIKMYKFVGVELSMRITSSSYLLPTSTSQQDAAQQPLLAAHKQRFAHLFGVAAPRSESSTSGQASSNGYAALQQSMSDLRSELHRGLLQQRVQLSASNRHERWLDTAQGQQAGQDAAAAAAAGAAGGHKQPGQQVQDLVAQQLEGSSLLPPSVGADSSSFVGGSREHALLAAIDKLVAGVKVDVLDRHKFFPYLMAFYQPGKHQQPAAEWMQAMLMYGKQRQQEVQASQQAAVVQSYQQYGQVSRALLLLMLQQWYKAADGASRAQLVLPDAQEVDNMLN